MPAAASLDPATSSRAALDRLERVLNARDLAEACPHLVAPGRLFRSANPSPASAADVLLLRRDLRITHMLDFRSAEEQREDRGWPLVLAHGTIRSYDGAGRLVEVAVDGHAALAAALGGAELAGCELQRLSLLEKDRFIWGLLRRLPYLKTAQALGYRLLGWDDAMRDVLVPEVNRGGLPWVYEILLESAQADIRRALELVLAAAQARRPTLIFCKVRRAPAAAWPPRTRARSNANPAANRPCPLTTPPCPDLCLQLGKDRTGVMAALLLTCAGASEAEIVADYARSDGVDDVALGGLEKMRDMQVGSFVCVGRLRLRRGGEPQRRAARPAWTLDLTARPANPSQGMDSQLFSRAPPQAMEALLKYARARYGGLAGYMAGAGFGEAQQAALRRALTEGPAWG
jgi:hypothetical protein